MTLVMNQLPPDYVETTVAIWWEINGIIGRYVRGVALDGLAVGILAAVGLWAIGAPFPLLLGLFAGLANTIPFLGPVISFAATGLVVMTAGQGLAGVTRAAVLFMVLKIIDDTVIQPQTIGRTLHLHPMLLLASVVAGSHALGVLGMIIAVPATTIVQETSRLLLEHRRGLRRVRAQGARTPVLLV
jgi:predicted PurR-regulated permease PerM